MRKALVVGINDYPGCPLYACVEDANAMEAVLSRNENGDPNFEVQKCLDIKNRANLRRLIEECFSGQADVALFYFSGHGTIDASGGCIVTPDCQEGGMGVSMQEILGIVNSSQCRSKIVILDCCYSGAMGRSSFTGTDSALGDGVTILTASLENESSVEVGGHGVFTSLLLSALEGGAADIMGNITPGGIYSYIDKALGPWDQRPVFKTNVSQFTSLRNVEPQVSREVLRNLTKYFASPTDQLNLDPSFEKTNSPEDKHEILEPYADPQNVKIFTDLQKLESVGVVVPCEEEHMYYAAMNSKACKLTAIGRHYWYLVKTRKI